MGFFSRKNQIDSATIANTLVNEFIDNSDMDKEFLIEVPVGLESKFQAKARLYRLTLVLTALTSEEKQNSAFTKVRECLEVKLLPNTSEEGVDILSEINTAKQHFADLFFPEGNPREMSWAMRWLGDIGVDESNPATLALFSMKWMNSYIAIVKFLRECKL